MIGHLLIGWALGRETLAGTQLDRGTRKPWESKAARHDAATGYKEKLADGVRPSNQHIRADRVALRAEGTCIFT